uniref:Mcl1_mid domain-containing protein n=1 Tax=Steinernema glaseri TaxID=37863 RepID=A0A1I7YT04_9BILA
MSFSQSSRCPTKERRSKSIPQDRRSYDYESFTSGVVCATAVDPLSQIYAVLTGAGKLLFYPVQKDSSNETGCTQALDVPYFYDSEKLKFSISFSRERDQFYVPSKGRVVIFRRDGTSDWEEASSLSYPVNEELCLCSLSKGGRFLAVTTASNKVVVWDVEASIARISSSFAYRDAKMPITSIISNPPDNEEVSLIVADSELQSMPIAPTTTIVEYDPPTVPAPFVSGAMPMKLQRRILKRNEHGTITSYEDFESSQLDIRFHNTALFHPIDLNHGDTRYVYGDISTKTVALSSAREGSTRSELYVHHIASTDVDTNKSKWSVQLSGKESIQLVTLAERFVAFYTSYGHIRIFSLAGTQRTVFSHPGKIMVSMYTVELRDVDLPVLTQQVPVAITPGSELAWAAYSAKGALCSMDSQCCIRMLSASAMLLPYFGACLAGDHREGRQEHVPACVEQSREAPSTRAV